MSANETSAKKDADLHVNFKSRSLNLINYNSFFMNKFEANFKYYKKEWTLRNRKIKTKQPPIIIWRVPVCFPGVEEPRTIKKEKK
jgi:hypothetical protein